MDIGALLGNGFSIDQILEGAQKIKQFLPVAKKLVPQLTELEKTFELKPNQKIIYSVAPVGENLMIYILVAQEMPDKTTQIVEIKNQFNLWDEIEKFTGLIPDLKKEETK